MERIVYRKTLDVHKNGIQFTLQGFETADNMARRIEISLMASGDTIDLPLEQIVAMMYVTTPNATEPSINQCTIKDNKIIYDVLPIVEEGITEMQLKLIETSPNGAKSVLGTPRFAAEVTKGNIDDSGATQTTTFTALEDAIARANGVYESRLEKIEVDNDCTFRAIFADGTVYENDSLKEAIYNGNALLSQSYARGDSGVREGEETDNSMYYSNVSKSASIQAEDSRAKSEDVLEEARKHSIYTAFSVDFNTGEVKYISPSFTFNINKETGELNAEGEVFVPEENVDAIVTSWLANESAKLGEMISQESDARSTKDNQLEKKIDDEIATRSTGYSQLEKKIDDEITTRGNADTQFRKEIDTLNQHDYKCERNTLIKDGVTWHYEKWWNTGDVTIWGMVKATYSSGHVLRAHSLNLPTLLVDDAFAWASVNKFSDDSSNDMHINAKVFCNPDSDKVSVSVHNAAGTFKQGDEINVAVLIKSKWK